MANNFLITGSEKLGGRKNFKLVGRAEKFEELCTILTRMESNSVIVSGPSGVGITTLALALQARKADADAPFDIVNKRLFWLDTDGLFGLGENDAIVKQFKGIFAILDRTPDSVLIVEDTLDLIGALNNSGLMHIVNALTAMVKAKKTQVFLEVREADLTQVFKCHSDFRDHFTLMDLTEPVGAELEEIVLHGARDLEESYEVRIDPAAVKAAIEMSSKYRSLDTGLTAAQPARTRTLLDRGMARYLLRAHSTPPMLAELEARADASHVRRRVGRKRGKGRYGARRHRPPQGRVRQIPGQDQGLLRARNATAKSRSRRWRPCCAISRMRRRSGTSTIPPARRPPAMPIST